MSTQAVPGAAHLGAHACWALLRDSEVGRLAVLADGRPDIYPVNFVIDHGSIVIRTGPGTTLAAVAHGAAVAFEADGYDAATGEAWSVVVKGAVERHQTIQEMVDVVALPLFPWHAGSKPCWVRVVPGDVTGRRFGVLARSHRQTAL